MKFHIGKELTASCTHPAELPYYNTILPSSVPLPPQPLFPLGYELSVVPPEPSTEEGPRMHL